MNFEPVPPLESDYTEQEVLSVTQLNQRVKLSLETQFNQVCVSGEISNYARPLSGHLYFTLKDAFSELRCVFFRAHQRADYMQLLKDGVAVELVGQITLYPQRGQYQMLVSSLRLQGEGLLKQQFLALKQRLEAMGLFDPSKKKILPTYPQTIGVISSPKAAGLDDFITILAQRYPIGHVRLFTSPVQGHHAAASLIQALKQAEADPEVDVIIFCRGGGSLEDLWCFNDEHLAHAIHACSKPIISAVGHEKDITICDLVADVRAATPTNAAMIVAPNMTDLQTQLSHYIRQIAALIQRILREKQLAHSQISARICHPMTRINHYQFTLAQSTHRLLQLMTHYVSIRQRSVDTVYAKLSTAMLTQQHQRHLSAYQQIQMRLHTTILTNLSTQSRNLDSLCARLHALNPQHVLKRGYAVVKCAQGVIHSHRQLKPQDRIDLVFHDGHSTAIIQE